MTDRSLVSWRAYLGLAIAAAAAYAMSTLFSAMKPILLTRFIEQVGYPDALAGLIVAMPFVGIASSSLLMHGRLTQLSYFTIVSVFGALLVSTELLAAFYFETKSIVLVCQFIGGVSVGVLMGTTSRCIATTASPDQLFGFVDMTAVLLMSVMVFAGGAAVEYNGLQGGFLFAALSALGYVLLMYCFRDSHVYTSLDQNHHARPALTIRPIIVISMGMLFVTCSGLGFAFMFSMAKSLGMSYDNAGTQIGIILFFSAFACQAGGWVSARVGPLIPLGCAFVVCALGWVCAIHASSPVLFLVALVPATFSLQFNFPILLALAGALDETGTWAGVATPLLTSGFAWAAILAGVIVGQWDIAALAIATTVGMTTCLALLLLLAKLSRAH